MWFITYIREVKAEFAHIAWPTSKQVVVYTMLVLAISAVVAVYLGGLDFVFKLFVQNILA